MAGAVADVVGDEVDGVVVVEVEFDVDVGEVEDVDAEDVVEVPFVMLSYVTQHWMELIPGHGQEGADPAK